MRDDLPAMKRAKTYESVDPAPTSVVDNVYVLKQILENRSARMFDRMEALFGLRALGTDEAIAVIAGVLLTDPSALLRHECAFVFGQMRNPLAVPYLRKCIETDPSPMVRHEAIEDLGAIGDPELKPFLEEVMRTNTAVEVRESCEVAMDNIDYLNDGTRF